MSVWVALVEPMPSTLPCVGLVTSIDVVDGRVATVVFYDDIHRFGKTPAQYAVRMLRPATVEDFTNAKVGLPVEFVDGPAAASPGALPPELAGAAEAMAAGVLPGPASAGVGPTGDQRLDALLSGAVGDGVGGVIDKAVRSAMNGVRGIFGVAHSEGALFTQYFHTMLQHLDFDDGPLTSEAGKEKIWALVEIAAFAARSVAKKVEILDLEASATKEQPQK